MSRLQALSGFEPVTLGVHEPLFHDVRDGEETLVLRAFRAGSFHHATRRILYVVGLWPLNAYRLNVCSPAASSETSFSPASTLP